MLIEQAFMALPEFLTGAPFKKYQNEGTVVTAFSMAVLQELNSRNVLNPVAALREEVNYPSASSWRADLHLDLAGMKIFTPELSSYGYYQNNWLEAKYSRLNEKGTPTVTNIVTTFLLLKDVIRICALPPDSIAGTNSESGRYLLHAYQGGPMNYFTLNRNSGGKRAQRSWINSLLTPGVQSINTLGIGLESGGTFEKQIGKNAKYIEVSLKVTNLAHIPKSINERAYYIVLTKVDDFSVKIGNRSMGRKAGVMYESHPGNTFLIPSLVSKLLAE